MFAAVFLPDVANGEFLPGFATTARVCAVGGAIIDDEPLKIVEGLRLQALVDRGAACARTRLKVGV